MDAVRKTDLEYDFIIEECCKMAVQFKKKNVAYGDSFGKQFAKYGPISALVRMSDKFSRVESLLLGAENGVTDERVEDTLVDMACYCMMTYYELCHRDDGKTMDGSKQTPGVLNPLLDVYGEEIEKPYWIVWPGWEGNCDKRIEGAKCSKCGYIHPTVKGSLTNLCKKCPGCGVEISCF